MLGHLHGPELGSLLWNNCSTVTAVVYFCRYRCYYNIDMYISDIDVAPIGICMWGKHYDGVQYKSVTGPTFYNWQIINRCWELSQLAEVAESYPALARQQTGAFIPALVKPESCSKLVLFVLSGPITVIHLLLIKVSRRHGNCSEVVPLSERLTEHCWVNS